MRMLSSPGTFFNQLQWSRRHWMILVAFLGIAAVESQVGRQVQMYHAFAQILERRFHLSLDQALWVVTFARLALLATGAFAIMTLLWIVGNLFGRRTSRRVLFRRLAIVFTVFLAGFTAQHLTVRVPQLVFVTGLCYVWGVVLGYFALREQFALNHLETAVVSLFAALLVTSSWHYMNHAAARFARSELRQAPVLAPAVSSVARAPRPGLRPAPGPRR